MLEIYAYKPLIMRDGWKPLKESVRKKTLETASQACVWLQRKVKNRIRKNTSKKDEITVEYDLFRWDKRGERWIKCGAKPTEFMAGKKSVVDGAGRGGRTRVKEVRDSGIRRVNAASKPGEGPRSHPTDVPGWTDRWLHQAVYWDGKLARSEGSIRVFIDEKNGGKNVRRVLRALEFGGASEMHRKWVVGYYIGTIRNGYWAERGDGETLGNSHKPKTVNDGAKVYRHELKTKGGKQGRYVNAHNAKNKSGKTRQTHYRQFKQTHVSLRQKWAERNGNVQIAARPFMAPVQDAFFKEHFPQLYRNMLEE